MSRVSWAASSSRATARPPTGSPYDSTWSMIAPVPEPSTYGAIFLTAGLALVAYRRHRATKKAA